MNDSVKHIKMHTKCIGLIIPPNDSFLVSTSIKVKGIESEKHTSLCMLSILCRSHVIDDTRLYTYFIGTCIFYSVILGTPLLCSQCVKRVFLWVTLYQWEKNEEDLNVFWQSESFQCYCEVLDYHTGVCKYKGDSMWLLSWFLRGAHS